MPPLVPQPDHDLITRPPPRGVRMTATIVPQPAGYKTKGNRPAGYWRVLSLQLRSGWSSSQCAPDRPSGVGWNDRPRLLEEAQKEVLELAGLEQGSIHLATSTLTRLSEPLGKFLSLHPNVNMQITQASTSEIAQLIENGGVDIGFTAMPVDHPGIAHATVLKEDLYLAVHRKHRLASRPSIRLSDAADEPFIGYKEGFVFQKMNDLFFREAGISPKFVCRVDEPAAVVSLVRTGLGVALFGCKSGENSDLTLLPIEHPVCQRNYQLIWSDKRYFSLAARKFREFVIQYFSNR